MTPALTPLPRAGLGLPLMLGLLALLLSLAIQTALLVSERRALATVSAAQGPAMDEGDRVRDQLESLLSGASALAAAGNGAAQAAMEALGRQGISYTPPTQTKQAPLRP